MNVQVGMSDEVMVGLKGLDGLEGQLKVVGGGTCTADSGLLVFIPMAVGGAERIKEKLIDEEPSAERKFMVLEYARPLTGFVSTVYELWHGGYIKPGNFAAVVSGKLHTKGACSWCDELRRRIAISRVF